MLLLSDLSGFLANVFTWEKHNQRLPLQNINNELPPDASLWTLRVNMSHSSWGPFKNHFSGGGPQHNGEGERAPRPLSTVSLSQLLDAEVTGQRSRLTFLKPVDVTKQRCCAQGKHHVQGLQGKGCFGVQWPWSFKSSDKPGGLKQVISSVRGLVSSYMMEVITLTSPGPLCEPDDIKSEKNLHKETDLVKCRAQSLWPSEKAWGSNRWQCCTLKKTTVHLLFQEITYFHFLWCLNAQAPWESGPQVLWASAIEIQKLFPINHPPKPVPLPQAQKGASPPAPAPGVPVTPCTHTPSSEVLTPQSEQICHVFTGAPATLKSWRLLLLLSVLPLACRAGAGPE